MTPFETLYGFSPQVILGYVPSSSAIAEVHELLCARTTLDQELQYQLKQTQEKMKKHADRTRRDVVFTVEDWVLLKLHKYQQ